MCNHCQSHGLGEDTKNQVRKGFLKMLADSSSQISEMDAGVLIKNLSGNLEIDSFGSLDGILSMTSHTYIATLKVALNKAKSENDIEMAFMLFNQIVTITDGIKEFMNALDKTTDEIKASMMGGIHDGRSTKS